MRKAVALILFASMGGALLFAQDGDRDERREFGVERFATLPARSLENPTPPPKRVALGHPEGLCADRKGHIYADSFEQPIGGPGGVYVQNYIYTFGHDGELLAATPTPTGVVPLGCTVSGDKFYMNDVYGGNELEYTLPLTETSLPVTYAICGGFVGHPGLLCALNANYPGPDGRIYMSDNGAALFGDFIGRIWVLDPKTGSATIFLDTKAQLGVAQLPLADYVPNLPNGTVLPYSVNGIAFSRDGSALYFANMSTNTIYKQKVWRCWDAINGCEPEGAATQFSRDPRHVIQGPDNMDFDEHGNLWIASGQDQHVVALNREGEVVGVFGAFLGFDKEGAPRGLLQPSGVIFSKGQIYIGNESSQSLLPAADPIDWTKLKRFTISTIDADILERER